MLTVVFPQNWRHEWWNGTFLCYNNPKKKSPLGVDAMSLTQCVLQYLFWTHFWTCFFRVLVIKHTQCSQERLKMFHAVWSSAALATRAPSLIHRYRSTRAGLSSPTPTAAFSKQQVCIQRISLKKSNLRNRNKHRCSDAMFFISGLYCSGWLKTGPTGVIATTMNNSFDTAMSLMEDMASGLVDLSAARAGSQSIAALLEKRGTPSALLITSLVFRICQISVF